MPEPRRKFIAANLLPGLVYQVTRAFKDYDGIVHPVGESWRFTEKNFVPYEDGLCLFVESNGQKIMIRLQWRDETQGELIDNFSDYVKEI